MYSVKQDLTDKKIGVILTDTIYGIVGLALEKDVVERVFRVKKRNPKKPLVVLISSIDDLKSIFEIDLNSKCLNILKEFWPGKVSVVLPCKKYPHLHRGLNSIAFRFPNKKELVDLIKEVGPIIATSVNKEGEIPAKNITEAKECFKNELDFYIDGGEVSKEPSMIVRLVDENELEVLRGKLCLRK
ncbi:MAG: L-threonylcarbamoyladenylate synthase [Candidatus Pacebacteria bacterium]|nr:L-threonylcarbamoyladenylate synthase [Candidatus Paceibacterota bacterium]